ncbi:MAG TPA: PKD domain-containing protein [Acidimicrobiales bacterium]|nr:PKD domain-containing protein [Acidimicrobiales bacterium]
MGQKQLGRIVAAGMLTLGMCTTWVLATAAPGAAESPPTSCSGQPGKYYITPPSGWANECQMVNDTNVTGQGLDRETFVIDPGAGNFLSRDEVLANAGIYEAQGFGQQFLWYAPMTRVTPDPSSKWSACHAWAQRIGGDGLAACTDVNTSPLKTIGQDLTVDDTLDVISYGSNWIAMACGNFALPVQLAPGNTYVPAPVPVIHGFKFNDANRDGTQDNGETGVGGIKFTLTRISSFVGQPVQQVDETTSAADGTFNFDLDNNEGPGTYVVSEVANPNWVPTTPGSQTVVVPEGAGDASYQVTFGDRQEIPPVADAGPAQAVDQSSPQGAHVTLDGSGSYSPTGDALSYTWSGPFGTAQGVNPTVIMPPGTNQVTLTVSDGVDTTTAPPTWVTVWPPITANAVPVLAVEGSAFSGTVATFTDPDPSGQASDYVATVDWGDGSPPTTGAVTQLGGGLFSVKASHTFAEEGSYTATVTIADDDVAYNSATVDSSAEVSDAPLVAGAAVPVVGVEGKSVTTTVGTFRDANAGATVTDFTAMVNWGDGTPASPGVVAQSPDGTFSVTGTHTYAEEGIYTPSVQVVDDGGASAEVITNGLVSDAQLTATGVTLNSVNPVDGVLATFTDANPTAPLSDFTATIDWGDGTPDTVGQVSGPTGGTFSVSGSHTYATLGPKTITVHIVDVGGSTATACSHVIVYAVSGFVIGDENAAVGTRVTFWGAQWWKLNSLSGGPAPAAFKGYEDSPGPVGSLTNWSTTPGNSAGPPATVPSYMSVIVSSSIVQAGTTISGDAPHIVIVQTDPGYASDPGHAGTGTVVATIR